MNTRKLFLAQFQNPELSIFVLAVLFSLFLNTLLIFPVSDYLTKKIILEEKALSPEVDLLPAPKDSMGDLVKKDQNEEKIFTDPKKRILNENAVADGPESNSPIENKSHKIVSADNKADSGNNSKSPLYVKKDSAQEQSAEGDDHENEIKIEDKIPEEILKSMRGREPEKTNEDDIQFTLNDYKWTFDRYVENWAADLKKWWRAPSDYLNGEKPNGGSVWIKVELSRQGELKGYKVYDSAVTSEMELRVIQALIGSFERPALPEEFPSESLVVNWRFIYPPLHSLGIDLKKK